MEQPTRSFDATLSTSSISRDEPSVFGPLPHQYSLHRASRRLDWCLWCGMGNDMELSDELSMCDGDDHVGKCSNNFANDHPKEQARSESIMESRH